MYIKLNNECFKVIKENSQKAKNIIEKFNKSTVTQLSQCYKNYSLPKEVTFEYCKYKVQRACDYDFINYSGMRILSFNSNFFSCACTITIANTNYLMYFTHSNDYIIPFEN